MKNILEAVSALLILLIVEFGMVTLGGTLSERWDIREGLCTVIAGLGGLFIWFCIVYTIHHRADFDKVW